MLSDAYRFLFPILGIAAILAFLNLPTLALVFVLLGGFVCYFFRNPEREIPSGDNLIVSPADGKVVKISPFSDEDGRPQGHAISIFLRIYDVHVNRSPIDGQLEDLEYRRGRFKVALKEEASRVNEQNVLRIQGDAFQVTVKQIAGFIARRVVCWKSPGNPLKRGELIGLIRFGSRVDIVVPPQVKVLVQVGDLVKGGSSILGSWV
jgi:phosphatidylserine decarboxylase